MLRNRRAGNSMMKFTLVGIPMVFILVSTFEMARGMWTYHTLAYAVREGTRFAAFHGSGCNSGGNSCSKTIGDIAAQIQYAGVGLLPDQLNLSFTSNAGTVSCLLKDCLTDTTIWPPNGANSPGVNVEIDGHYPFSSGIALFWPGAGSGLVFPTFNLPAASQELIQF